MKRKLLLHTLAGLAIGLFFLTPGLAQSVMTHHVRDAVRNGEARPVGRLPQNQVLQIDVVLPLRDPQGLKSFLADVYNPKSQNYRHFLTPAEFTARFGPTAEQYNAVLHFANEYGLGVVGGSRDSMEVQIKGSVGAIEAAFHVNLKTYQHPTENRIFFATDQEPTHNLPFNLWHVSGLDNYSIPHPHFVKKADYAAAHGMYPDQVVSHATTGSGPSASFLGSDMRAAYYGGTALNGAGQHVGLLEYYGTDLSDLNTYYSNVHQTNSVPVNLISTDGTSTSCTYFSGCDDTEQTLDMTQALGMAPALSTLDVYIGSSDTAIIGAMTSHNPLPGTIGCSWGWTPADASTLDPYFQRMASQGQNFFAASGDNSTWSSSNEAWPADDANVVSVGGTDLVTAGAAGPWSSETAWVDGGGGISPDGIGIPSWQQLSGVINSSNRGSTSLRNGPDVSANANFTFYVCADQSGCTANNYGGTSFAAPMWAGYIALVNQQLAANGKSAIGFINPTIYQQNVGSQYAADFHDITSGTSGSYSAVTGYDLVTGWGSPNAGLIAALAGGSSGSPSFSISASPGSVSVVQGQNGSSTISTTVSGGFNSAIALSASGQPSGVTVTFNPSSIAAPGGGSSTMSIGVASTVAAGTYNITVTGSGGNITHTTTVSLTVTAPGSGSLSVSVSPSSGYLYRGQSGYAVVTTSVSGGFNSAVALSVTGVPSRVTASFSPSSIAAPGGGTSDLNLSVSRYATRGTYSLTIKASGGGKTATTVLTLQIR